MPSLRNPKKRISYDLLRVEFQWRILNIDFLLFDQFLFIPVFRINVCQFLVSVYLWILDFDLSLILIVHLVELLPGTGLNPKDLPKVS